MTFGESVGFEVDRFRRLRSRTWLAERVAEIAPKRLPQILSTMIRTGFDRCCLRENCIRGLGFMAVEHDRVRAILGTPLVDLVGESARTGKPATVKSPPLELVNVLGMAAIRESERLTRYLGREIRLDREPLVRYLEHDAFHS
jgi:hypothetical protein